MARISLAPRTLLFGLGLGLGLGSLASCDRPSVGEIDTSRHAACEEGYECASGLCESPEAALEELGCFSAVCVPQFGTVCLAPDTEWPNCEDPEKGPSTYCGVEACKAECEMICDNDGAAGTEADPYTDPGGEDPEEEACYTDCESNDEDGCFVRRVACIDAYNQWRDDRDTASLEFVACIAQCEGELTAAECDELDADEELDNNCDELERARQLGATRAGDCTLDPEASCDWECSDIYFAG